MNHAFIIVFPILALLLSLPVVIGIYVYRDATQRGMNRAAWTLIAILTPVFTGFVIYLLVRSGHPNLKCQVCGGSVRGNYTVCPQCGAKLRPFCRNCSEPIEVGWIVCPKCTQPVDGQSFDIVAPVRQTDRVLGKILAMIIIIPVLVIVMGFIPFSQISSSGTLSAATMSIDEYIQASGDQMVEQWIGNCIDRETAYVLQYESRTNGQIEIHYLVYFANTSNSSDMGVTNRRGFWNNIVEINLSDDQDGNGDMLIYACYKGESVPNLEVRRNGKLIKCEITETDRRIGVK